MNDPTSQFFSTADQPSLTPQERTSIRLALQARMMLALHSVEKTHGRRSLQKLVYAEPTTVSASPWFVLSFRLPVMALSVLLLLGASGSLVFAAEHALPGEALYPVKLYVNEAVLTRFQSTPEGRAEWAVVRLQRRMDELHRLQARGVRDEDIEVVMGASIEETAHHVEIEVEALPAAAAERAAMRTAVRAAIGTEQDDIRRASRVTRVLRALHERSKQFDSPVTPSIAPVPFATVKVRVEDSADSLEIDSAIDDL